MKRFVANDFISTFEYIWKFTYFQAGLFPPVYFAALLDIMASQDLISQFTQDSPMIPASQPDRYRTPRRLHREWHQAAPTFRGPMRYAMTASRPMWPHSGVTPPPPPTPSYPSRPPWTTTPPNPLFPPTPPVLPHGPQDHNTFTPQRCGTITRRSPLSTTSPPGLSPVRQGYTCRPIDIPPIEGWKPDVEFHDSSKVNGLDFPSKIRQSRFSSFKDIEGMDPLQVPLWKFLYQGLHNTWLRRIAYGRGTFVLPFDSIGTTVFIAELVAQLRTRNVDLDKLAAYKPRAAGQYINQKEATQHMAKEAAQLMQSWLPSQPAADNASQQRILELEAELAKVKSENCLLPRRHRGRLLHLSHELYKDNHPLLHPSTLLACWCLLDLSTPGLWRINLPR